MLVEYLTGEEGGPQQQISAAQISRLIIAGDSLAPILPTTGEGLDERKGVSFSKRNSVLFDILTRHREGTGTTRHPFLHTPPYLFPHTYSTSPARCPSICCPAKQTRLELFFHNNPSRGPCLEPSPLSPLSLVKQIPLTCESHPGLNPRLATH
jgi:hypothetical protein